MFDFLKNNRDKIKHSKSVKRKRGGIKVKTTCAECQKEATYHECESTDAIKLYGVVKLFDYSKVVMQCDKCSATIKANDNPDTKRAFEERDQEIKDKEDQEKEKERKQLEEQRQKEEKLRQKEIEKAQAKQAKEIDDELEQLKNQLDEKED